MERTKWLYIKKDENGFVFDNIIEDMFQSLPILLVHSGRYPLIEYVDEDNWADVLHDLDKADCKRYLPCEALPLKD